MTCPDCDADLVSPPTFSSAKMLCRRCEKVWRIEADGALTHLPIRIPVFGWVTREEFDEILPPVSTMGGGILYDYGAVADELRAVRNWGNGLRQGARPTVVLSLIRQWVTGSDDFRARAFR